MKCVATVLFLLAVQNKLALTEWNERQPKIQSFFGPGVTATITPVGSPQLRVPRHVSFALDRSMLCAFSPCASWPKKVLEGSTAADTGNYVKPMPSTLSCSGVLQVGNKVEVALTCDGSGLGRGGAEQKDLLMPLMPGLKPRLQMDDPARISREKK